MNDVDFYLAFGSGLLASIPLGYFFYRAFMWRARQVAAMERIRRDLESRRTAIDSGREYLPRQGAGSVARVASLFESRPGRLELEHMTEAAEKKITERG